MLLGHLRNNVFVRLPLALPILNSKWKPPELDQFSLFMKIVGHLFDRISGKGVWPRIPVPISIEPAIVERGPLDVEFLQLGNCSRHLRRRDIEFISPAAPAHVVGLILRFWKLPSFLLQQA